MIRRLFKPFDTVFTVTIVSGDKKNGELIENQLRNFFFNNQLYILGGSCNYDDRTSIFKMYILDIEIKFLIQHIHLVIDYQNEDFDSITGDIVLFVTSTEEYSQYAYLSEVTATNRFLSNTSHISHIVLVYLGVEQYNNTGKNIDEWIVDLTSVFYHRCHSLIELADDLEDGLHVKLRNLIDEVKKHHHLYESCRTIDAVFICPKEDLYSMYNLLCVFLSHFLSKDYLNQFRYNALNLNANI